MWAGLALLVGGVAATGAHRALPVGDRTAMWGVVAGGFPPLLGVLLLLSVAAELLPGWWLSGYHLLHDQSTGSAVGGVVVSLAPTVLFVGVLWVAVRQACSRVREDSQWLVGTVGFGPDRRWLLPMALPVALVLVGTVQKLGTSPGMPLAIWVGLGLLLVLLVGVYSGQDLAPAAGAVSVREEKQPLSLQPWPEQVRARGVQIAAVGRWDALDVKPIPPVSGGLHGLEGRSVRPRLHEVFQQLVEQPTRQHASLIEAPDDSGQLEVMTAAALSRALARRERTLVIVRSDAAVLAQQIRQLHILPEGTPIFVGEGSVPVDIEAPVWVIDAEYLSRRFLQSVAQGGINGQRAALRRLGLLVWWNVHDYTGVLAANIWAISRRLDRLLREEGRRNIPVVVFTRSAASGQAQLSRFVARLLPYAFEQRSNLFLRQRRDRPVSIYLLDPTQRDLQDRRLISDLLDEARHPVVLAGLASVASGWPTALRMPAALSARARTVALEQPAPTMRLDEMLVAQPPAAGARLLAVADDEVLALPSMLAAGGSTLPPHVEQHVGLLAPHNPYARFALREQVHAVAKNRPVLARTLVGAEGTPANAQRHILLALQEQGETLFGLLNTFDSKNSDIVRRALDELSRLKKLTSEEVRFLDRDGRLKIDRLYSSGTSLTNSRPLDTVGSDLIAVNEVDAEEPGRMWLDPERLVIAGYPGRVFLVDGARYRIKDWSSVGRIKEQGFVSCQREDRDTQTHRIRQAEVESISAGGPRVQFGPAQKIARQVCRVTYSEHVSGYLEIRQSRYDGTYSAESHRWAKWLGTTFETRGLFLELSVPGNVSLQSALVSVSAALRWVIPVHVGVSADAMEIVAMEAARIRTNGRRAVSTRPGLVLIDLYPGGVGLIDAFAEDNALMLGLLQQALRWLDDCSCKSEAGCPECLQPLQAEATRDGPLPSRQVACRVLKSLVT